MIPFIQSSKGKKRQSKTIMFKDELNEYNFNIHMPTYIHVFIFLNPPSKTVYLTLRDVFSHQTLFHLCRHMLHLVFSF